MNLNTLKSRFLDIKIEKIIKIIFVNWLIAVLCYLPIISNSYTNSLDGLWQSSDFSPGNWELSLGRWGWYLLDKARGRYAAEPFNSFLSLMFLAMGACFLILVFGRITIKHFLYTVFCKSFLEKVAKY
ncbi:hypothetical protein [Butyrivibrio sp. AC2005]|uniref:hypothetical protein n=1 Tax=Butyrivibrio sp. AC2005 TaxID=1280672 RepID=UPI0012DE7782|nr:hypothetical protein [Butyrivibrio sp. AC2005]